MEALNKLIVVVFFCGIIWYFIGLEPSPQGYRTGSVQTMIIYLGILLIACVTLVVRKIHTRIKENRAREFSSRIYHRTYRQEKT